MGYKFMPEEGMGMSELQGKSWPRSGATGRTTSWCRRIPKSTEAKMMETFQGRAIAGRGDAESIAIHVLNFIVADVDRIFQFLNVTGLQPKTIRASAQSLHFLLGVLEYVAKDNELLKAIDQELKIRPAAILAAIVHLSPKPKVKPKRSLFH
jgi:hypothetical protein